MSVEPDAVQQDYRREERREHKAMESKLSGAKLNANTLSRAFDDNRSVGSGKSQKPLPAALFFQNAVAKIAAPIGPACQGKELNDFQRNPLEIEILSNLRFGSLEI
jgi:hypothetical protein